MWWWLLSLILLVIFLLGIWVVRARLAFVMKAIVSFRKSGEWDIELRPSKPLALQARALCLCYAAKIRWLLNTEAAEARISFLDLAEAALFAWPEQREKTLLENLRRTGPWVDSLRAGYAPQEARFFVELRHGENGWWVTNNLPRGPIGDLLWAFILVVDASLAGMENEEREELRMALRHLLGELRMPEADGETISDLHRLFTRANLAIFAGYGTA